MKKFVLVLILAVAALAVIFSRKERAENKKDQDYQKIEAVCNAMEKISKSNVGQSFDNQAQWYVFDIRVCYEKDGDFHKALQDELGADFDSKLSTGDYLFVGILPSNHKYKVFAGDPANESSMLYPEWKYTKLQQKQ